MVSTFDDFCVKLIFSRTMRARAMNTVEIVKLKATVNSESQPTFISSFTFFLFFFFFLLSFCI